MSDLPASPSSFHATRWLRVLAALLALLAAIDCLAVAIRFTQFQFAIAPPGWHNIFPLPGLYFIEFSALSLATLAVWLAAARRPALPLPRFLKNLTWFTAGVLLAFVILGGFSIGPFLIPALPALLGAALLSNEQQSWKDLFWVSLGPLLIIAALSAWGTYPETILVLLALFSGALLAQPRLAPRLWRFATLFPLGAALQTLVMLFIVLLEGSI